MEENQLKEFNFVDTTATKKIFSLTQRIRAVAGGTSASKTISILVWLIDYCQQIQNKQKLATVTSESYPNLEKGAMLDFEMIMKDRGYWNEARWNKTKHQYTFETNNVLEFAIFDTYNKAHGPRRDVLFINEGNHLVYNIVDQLITRTREIVWLDWNPTSEFWFYTDMQPIRDDIDFITLTYKDNEGLDQVTIDEIESHKINKNWWQVYGLGQLGEVEGRIYTGWKIIDEIPHEARLERRWLDFGYSNDPAAMGDMYKYNGGLILDEQLYRKGMSNHDLATLALSLDYALLVADSAEPKSIDELRNYGVSVIPSEKGKDSIVHGIQYLQSLPISVTKRSVNILKEYRNYFWMTEKDGRIINVPSPFLNHHMDGIRYAAMSLRNLDYDKNIETPEWASNVPDWAK